MSMVRGCCNSNQVPASSRVITLQEEVGELFLLFEGCSFHRYKSQFTSVNLLSHRSYQIKASLFGHPTLELVLNLLINLRIGPELHVGSILQVVRGCRDPVCILAVGGIFFPSLCG